MKKITILLLTLFFISCQNQDQKTNEGKIETLLNQVKEMTIQIDAYQSKLALYEDRKMNTLVHEVYFNLKDELTFEQRSEFENEIKKLQQIPFLKNLQIGNFVDLNDSRALADFEMLMTMDFQNQEDYKKYQNHPIHLSLKDAAKNYLAAPPTTYDYLLKK